MMNREVHCCVLFGISVVEYAPFTDATHNGALDQRVMSHAQYMPFTLYYLTCQHHHALHPSN